MRVLGLTLCLAMAVPLVAQAQSAAPPAPFREAMLAAAALQPVQQSPLTSDRVVLTVTQREFDSRTPGATLMIIGGAGLVAGAIVGGEGGTLMMLAGVGLGAYGFWLYTRN